MAKKSRPGQVAIGIIVIAAGLCVAALAAGHLVSPPEKAVLDPLVGLGAGFAFVFGGAITVVPERRGRARAWFAALMLTAIALLFDWVAFGPGEHHARGGAGPQLREMSRQALFASGAVLFDLMALWAWFRTRRAVWKKPAKA
jgi:hypothetical protein